MGDRKRIPFILNLDDPVDAAIWQQIEPLIQRHRASDFIRGALAQTLGITGGSPLLATPMPTWSAAGSIAAGQPHTKHMPPITHLQVKPDQDDPQAVDQAADNFLSMFG